MDIGAVDPAPLRSVDVDLHQRLAGTQQTDAQTIPPMESGLLSGGTRGHMVLDRFTTGCNGQPAASGPHDAASADHDGRTTVDLAGSPRDPHAERPAQRHKEILDRPVPRMEASSHLLSSADASSHGTVPVHLGHVDMALATAL